MISERLSPKWKITLALMFRARVFGSQPDVRKVLDCGPGFKLFADVWKHTLEPALRKALPITADEARRLLQGERQNYVQDGRQFREFTALGISFIAQLTPDATGEGDCEQLWVPR
jgi:hypothetical protein